MLSESIPDVKTFCNCDMETVEIHPFIGGESAVFSDRCPGKEGPNEDAAALIPFGNDSGALVVADGVGGVRGGEEAAGLAVRALEQSIFEAADADDMLRTGILNGFERANRAVLDLGVGAATTLAVVEIQGNSVRPYHVGDSAILVVGQRGKIKLQTVAHSPVAFAVAAGLIDELEAIHHEDRHLVSNVIGTPNMRIEIGSSIKLAPRDTLLLASDGLHDNLHLEEIVQLIRKGRLKSAVSNLARQCSQRMHSPVPGEPSKPDDLTLVVYRRTPPSRRSS